MICHQQEDIHQAEVSAEQGQEVPEQAEVNKLSNGGRNPATLKIMSLTKTDTHKRAVLKALEASMGIVSTACKKADISRETFYNWKKKDKEFAKKVEEASEIAKDFVESKLYKLINDENATAIIFYCKTKMKGRGYVERQEIDYNNEQVIRIVDAKDELLPDNTIS